MRKLSLVVVALVALSFTMGCGKKTPVDQMLGHAEEVLSLLKANKEDPAKAAAALKEYLGTNGAAIDAIWKELKTFNEGLSKEDQKKLEERAEAFESRAREELGDLLSNDTVREAWGKSRLRRIF